MIRPVLNSSFPCPRTSIGVVVVLQLSDVKDEITKASKETGTKASGAADQAKGGLGVSGGSDNPIAGRTADTVDKVSQHKFSLGR